MKEKKGKGLLGDVFLYGVGRALPKLLALVTVPVYVGFFAPEAYGALELAAVTLGFAALVAGLGMESASQRSFFDYGPEQEDERGLVLSTGFWFLVGWATLVGIALIFSRSWLGAYLFELPERFDLLLVAGLTAALASLGGYCAGILRMLRMPGRFLAATAGGACVGALAGVSLTLWTELGLYGPPVGQAAGAAVTLVCAMWLTRGYLRLRFDGERLREMLRYGAPLVPAAVMAWVMQFTDRYALREFADSDDLGVYGLAARIASVLAFVVTAFGMAWSPYILERYNEDPQSEPKLRAYAMTRLSWLLCVGAVLASLFAPEVVRILAPESYGEAGRAVPFLCFAVTFLGLGLVALTGISLVRRTDLVLGLTTGAAILNVLGNLWLVPRYGVTGASLATCVAQAVLFAGYLLFARRLSPAPYPYRRLGIVLLLTAALANPFVGEWLSMVGTELAIVGTKAVVGLAFIVVCAYVLGVRLEEVRSWLNPKEAFRRA